MPLKRKAYTIVDDEDILPSSPAALFDLNALPEENETEEEVIVIKTEHVRKSGKCNNEVTHTIRLPKQLLEFWNEQVKKQPDGSQAKWKVLEQAFIKTYKYKPH